jgi:integrase/recombinase XerD
MTVKSDSQSILTINQPERASQYLTQEIQSDEHLIQLWLQTERRRSERTRIEYLSDVRAFQAHAGLSLRQASLSHFLDYQKSLQHLSSATQSRRLSSLKSLFAFGFKLGYLPVNVAKVVTTPQIENTLSERILSEEELFRILSLETNPRNLLLLKLFYVSAGRISEVCALEWRNLQPRESGGQITFFGKGGKTRVVLIPENLWNELSANKPSQQFEKLDPHQENETEKNQTSNGDKNISLNSSPVFISQKGSQLSVSQSWRIVHAAAIRAGIHKNVSPHWFRHAHISHALDNGAPIHLVSETAGHSNVAVTSRYTHARPGESSSKYLKIK